MEYSRTRDVPDRIPFPEKTHLPNYVNQRIGHHTSKSGLHFHGHIPARNNAGLYDQGIYGGHHERETKVRNIPTYQSSIFTKHNYEKLSPQRERTYDVPLQPHSARGGTFVGDSGIHHTHTGRPVGSRTPPPHHRDEPSYTVRRDVVEAYNNNDRDIRQMIRTNGRADHVEKIIKANVPEHRVLDVDTTYKRKFGHEGFPRHYSPGKLRDPVGKISSTHWNAHDY